MCLSSAPAPPFVRQNRFECIARVRAALYARISFLKQSYNLQQQQYVQLVKAHKEYATKKDLLEEEVERLELGQRELTER